MCSGCLEYNSEENNDVCPGGAWIREQGTQIRHCHSISKVHDGDEIEHALGVGDGQESLVCCSSWSHKESDTPERLN